MGVLASPKLPIPAAKSVARSESTRRFAAAPRDVLLLPDGAVEGALPVVEALREAGLLVEEREGAIVNVHQISSGKKSIAFATSKRTENNDQFGVNRKWTETVRCSSCT